MITTTKYVCKRCGTEYNSISECEDCEKSHLVPRSVEFLYEPKMQWPYAVTVIFDDEEETMLSYSV